MRPGTLRGAPSPGTGPGVGGTQTDRSIPLLDPRTGRALHLLRVFFPTAAYSTPKTRIRQGASKLRLDLADLSSAFHAKAPNF